MASSPSAFLSPAALAQAKRQGMNLTLLSKAQVTELNALWTPASQAVEAAGRAKNAAASAKLDGPTNWKNLASYEGRTAAASLKSRPAANDAPADIASWLNSSGISPVFAFPEWQWNVSGDTASASYDLDTGNHVDWTADSSGNWHYHHTWGGFSLANTLDAVVSGLAIAADVGGFVFAGMFLHTAQAAANHEPLASLGQALKSDWDRMANSAELTFSIVSGQWQQAWDHATNYGNDLSGIIAAFGVPAPDRNGNLTITSKGTKPMAVKLPPIITGRVAAARQALAAPKPTPAQVAMSLAPGAPPPVPPPAKWYQKTLFTLGTHKLTTGEAGVVAVVGTVAAKLAGWL